MAPRGTPLGTVVWRRLLADGWRDPARQLAALHRHPGAWPPEGYIWEAFTRLLGLPVIGYDRLTSGTGEMRWRLLNLIPVVSAAGRDIARCAAGRLASEIVLIPTAFRDATWTLGASPDQAVATWKHGEDRESVEVQVGRDGRLLGVVMQRWGTRPVSRSEGPFGCKVEAERTEGGITIPGVFRAG